MISIDRELVEGRLEHDFVNGEYRTKLPIQRLVVADVSAVPGWSEAFCNTPFHAMLPTLNALLYETGLHQIAPEDEPQWPPWEWAETTVTGASYLLLPRLRYGAAYGLEIRAASDARFICDELLQESAGLRYFSNYEIDWHDGNIVDTDCVGRQVTNFTFEFGLFILSSTTITLLLSLDED